MLCSECSHALASISLNNSFGTTVLDYCSNCGGVWSDVGEINFLKENELEPLFRVLPQVATHPAQPAHICPKDRAKLELMRSESIPNDIDLFQCPVCRGVWFPEKALVLFKRAQKTKLDYYKTWKIPLHSVYAILLPLVLVAILSGGLLFTIVGFRQGTDVRTRASGFISKPLVLSPVTGQVLISFSTTSPAIAKIRYWKSPEEVTETWISATATTNHTIQLKYLDPGASYSYQLIVTDPAPYESPVYVFEVKNE